MPYNKRRKYNKLVVRYTHGMSRTPEYNCWLHIKSRCYNPNDKMYHYYGERGITMSEEWKNSFSVFLTDMGMKPDPKFELDRVDNNGNYCRENCRWIDKKTNMNNTRKVLNSKRVTINEREYTVRELSTLTGISSSTIHYRIKEGLEGEELIKPPTDRHGNVLFTPRSI